MGRQRRRRRAFADDLRKCRLKRDICFSNVARDSEALFLAGKWQEIGDDGRRKCVIELIAPRNQFSSHFAYSEEEENLHVYVPFYGSRNRSAVDHGSGDCTDRRARAVRYRLARRNHDHIEPRS
jgi:hypothetical protein